MRFIEHGSYDASESSGSKNNLASNMSAPQDI
jgi:hypothetical protein